MVVYIFMHMYYVAGYFWMAFIFEYFDQSFLFEIKFPQLLYYHHVIDC